MLEEDLVGGGEAMLAERIGGGKARCTPQGPVHTPECSLGSVSDEPRSGMPTHQIRQCT